MRLLVRVGRFLCYIILSLRYQDYSFLRSIQLSFNMDFKLWLIPMIVCLCSILKLAIRFSTRLRNSDDSF